MVIAMVPLLPPMQDTLVIWDANKSGVGNGSGIVTGKSEVHPKSSVMVTIYVPEDKLEAKFVNAGGTVFQK